MKDPSVATTVVIGLSALVVVALAHKNLEVRPGGNVTLSCANISRDETQVDWFRVENGTKANCISSMVGSKDAISYCAGFKNGRFRMSSNETDVFLNITEARPLDTGLYFCGFFIKSNIVLGNTTFLRVTGDIDPTKPEEKTGAQVESKFTRTYQLVIIILGSLSVVLAIVASSLAVKNCKLKKANKDLQIEANQAPVEDVNYATINVKAAKRHGPQTPHRRIEPQLIYSSTR